MAAGTVVRDDAGGLVGQASSASGDIGEVKAMVWFIKVGCSTVTELASRWHQPFIGNIGGS